jgi:hypothetical protein
MLLYSVVANISLKQIRPVAASRIGERSLESVEYMNRQASRTRRRPPQDQGDHGNKQPNVSMRDVLKFCRKHMAVLESIKRKGELMQVFEQEWLDTAQFKENQPSPLPSTQHIRLKAQELLREFVENPLPDIRDFLRAKKNTAGLLWKIN